MKIKAWLARDDDGWFSGYVFKPIKKEGSYRPSATREQAQAKHIKIFKLKPGELRQVWIADEKPKL